MNFNKVQRRMNKLAICLLLLLITAELITGQVPTQAAAPEAPKQETTVGTVKDQPASPQIPSNISVPNGYTFSFALFGSGYNGYTCRNTSPASWELTSVEVDLINNNNDHYDPAYYVAKLSRNSNGTLTFESVLEKNDNSSLTVSKDAKVSSPDNSNKPFPSNADWERYSAVATTPGGSFSSIGYVVVVGTREGAPGAIGECGVQFQDGSVDERLFYASYYFYSGPIPQPSSTSSKSEALMLKPSGYVQLGLLLIIGFVAFGITQY